MTYDAAATTTLGGNSAHQVYRLELSTLSEDTTYNVRIWDGTNDRYNSAYTSSPITDNVLLSAGTGVTLSNTGNSSNYFQFTTRSVDADSVGTYVFYYDLITHKFFIHYPVQVTYNGNGITDNSYAMVKYGGTANTKALSVTGYTQASASDWYNEPGLSSAYNFATALTSDKVIYAKLTAKQAGLRFDLNGGSASTTVADDALTATYGSAMPAYTGTTPTKVGYNFAGFYIGNVEYYTAGLASAQSWDVDTTSSTTLTAKWAAKTSTVTIDYDTNYGSDITEPSSFTATYGQAMPSKSGDANFPPADKTGYTFQGLFDNTSGGTKYYNADGSGARTWDKENGAVTLYAQWTENTSAINIAAYTNESESSTGGTVSAATTTAGVTTVGSASVASTTSGYTFVGWTVIGTDAAKVSLFTNPGCSVGYVPGATNATVYIKTNGDADVSATVVANFLQDFTISLNAVYTDDGTNFAAVASTQTSYCTTEDGAYTTATSCTVNYNRDMYLKAAASYVTTIGGQNYTNRFIGWYNGASLVSSEAILHIEDVTANASYTAKYQTMYEFSAYPSYIWDYKSTRVDGGDAWEDDNGDPVPGACGYYVRKAAAPSSYKIDDGEKTSYTSGAVIEVPAGSTIVFYYSGLSSSEMINEFRDDNGHVYTDSAPNITHFSMDGASYATSTIGYAGTVIPAAKYTYSAAEQSVTFDVAPATNRIHHKNITIVLTDKQQITLNDNDYSGIEVAGLNTEGYYFPGEKVGYYGGSGTEIRITLASASDRTYFFTGAVSITNASTGAAVTDVTVTPYDGTDAEVADPATDFDDISYYIISGETMPNYGLNIHIGVNERYTMRLSNAVISDKTNNKVMITQSNNSAQNNGSSSPDVSGDETIIGTVTAVASSTGDISTDGGRHWVYPATSAVYEDNPTAGNNYFLSGGVNKTGSTITKGETVTYTLTWLNGSDAQYSFVGWFTGSVVDGQLVPNYNKKIGSTTTLSGYTPKANTVVFAVVTHVLFLGGNFDSSGVRDAECTTNPAVSDAATHTWLSNRIKLNYDPTYVDPTNSSNKGRYYYTFDKTSFDEGEDYIFRVYDSAASATNASKTTWNQYRTNSQPTYDRKINDPDPAHAIIYTDSINNGRYYYDTDSDDLAWFNLASGWTDIGYEAPVTVYFYAYNGAVSVESTYRWSKVYVSGGRGTYVTNSSAVIDSGASATFNEPSVTVEDKTVNDKDVDVETATIGESIKVCTVHEDDGTITVTADSDNAYVDVEAFLVYNLVTKSSYAIKTGITNTSGNLYQVQIKVPGNSKLYVVPIYKYTDAYMTDPANNMAQHTVYVNVDDSVKSTWGGLVSIYSWGTTDGLSNGGFPGQLMIPDDTGKKFSSTLQYFKGGLAGVLFNNYYNSGTFIGNYYNMTDSGAAASGDSDRICTTAYNASNITVQTYDYREPISILDNIEHGYYEDEDMDLTFAIKSGNKSATDLTTYASATSWEYLMNRAGTKRVDLNGKEISTNPAATYYVVCAYTRGYHDKDGEDNYYETYTFSGAEGTRNEHSIDWYVYQAGNTSTPILHNLSAAYTDINGGTLMTEIARQLDAAGYAVSGQSVKIAYENPKNAAGGSTLFYSGQWYADGTNTLVSASVRVGVYGDGVFTPMNANSAGYGTATVAITDIQTAKGESYPAEDGCSGNSKATVIRKRAQRDKVTLTVDESENFKGWYYYDEDEETYKPLAGDNTGTSITVRFGEDTVYYAFYSASATYVFQYHDRNNVLRSYTVSGGALTSAELAAGGTLNTTLRASDASTKLRDISNIKVFNRTLTLDLATANNATPYYIYYTGTTDAETSYTLTVYAYDSSGTLDEAGTISGSFSKEIDLTESVVGSYGAGTPLTTYKPADHPEYVFIGWKKYNGSTVVGDYLSTQHNYGYSITQNLTIAPVFGTVGERTAAYTDQWTAYIDKNEITQELSNATTGTIYNDSLVAFRYTSYSGERFDTSANECGVLILVQEKDAEDGQKTAFTGLTTENLQSAVRNMVTADKTSAKLNNATYGKSYVLRIKVDSLSKLNRVNIYQQFDYLKFSGGNYKLIAYAKVGGSYVYSDPVSSTLTNGVKLPAA